MNYANMIEEKNLKKTFIIATLCSTLVGTFTTSIGLWDRVNEKRKQKHKDTKQDDEIKKLKEQVENAEKKHKEKEEEELSKRRDRRDDVYDNFDRSGMMIQRQFDEGYGRMGRRFAQGDTITENQLQAQIITLQQTVIQVLQDALYSGRELSRADMAKLIAASNSAREGSLDALRQQQNRLALDSPPSTASSVISRSRSLSAPRRTSMVIDSGTEPLYCRYSLDLQYIPNKPLNSSFAPGGSNRCPSCPSTIGAAADDFWQIGKRVPLLIPTASGHEKEVLSTREFTLAQRFVIKCHTPDGQYACVICNRTRDVDAVCRSVDALVRHVGRFHDVWELEGERDLREEGGVGMGSVKLLEAPAPPPSLGVGGGKEREVRVEEVRQYVR